MLIFCGGILLFSITSLMSWQAYKNLHLPETQFKKNNSIKIESEREKKLAINQINKEEKSEEMQSEKVEKSDKTKELEKIIWPVPFAAQAPFARWDKMHEETCEEAALIMLKYYQDKKELTPKIIEKELQNLIEYQIKERGTFYDTDIKTTKKIGEEYYKMRNLKILENFTINDLKKELVGGNIILIPTAGRELKNPNFTAPGPLYHNLVIIGYDDEKKVFITNDPGTRRGKKYEYKQQLLYDAIHDFSEKKEKILQGKRKALILVKPKF